MSKKHLLGWIAALGLTVPIVTGVVTAFPASAATTTQATSESTAAEARTATGSMTSFVLAGYGSNGMDPTWFWGPTHLCVTDFSNNDGVAKVQAVIGGAGPEYIQVGAFQQNCIDRWWWGNPVRVTNVSDTTLLVTSS